MSTDKAQEYYANKNKQLHLDKTVDGFAIASFILALAPLYILFVPILNIIILLTAPLSVVLGIVSIFRIREKPHLKGMGYAIAGIAIGIFTSLILLLALIVLKLALFSLFQ